jgi:hydrogenase maturation protein HypF
MIASLDGFERFGHLDYFSLGGGDKASKEAIRPLLGLITKAYGEEFELDDFGWLLEPIEPDKIKRRLIAEQIEKQINTVQTSSLGRVFDAVAAAIGLGNYNYFEAQLPIALEAIAKEDIEEHYAFEITGQGPAVIDISIMIKEIINDIHNKVEPGVISSKFHNCIAEALISLAEKARGQSGIETVAISGGVFCNRYLANRVIKGLRKSDFEVLFNKLVPSNDGGIALGQAAIAARRL